MSTKHTIDAEIEVKFHLSGAPDDEREVAYPKVRIAYTFADGAPPHRSDIADPGYPAEVEVESATLIDGDGLAPKPQQVSEWATDWLGDAGYEVACKNAREDRRERSVP